MKQIAILICLIIIVAGAYFLIAFNLELWPFIKYWQRFEKRFKERMKKRGY